MSFYRRRATLISQHHHELMLGFPIYAVGIVVRTETMMKQFARKIYVLSTITALIVGLGAYVRAQSDIGLSDAAKPYVVSASTNPTGCQQSCMMIDRSHVSFESFMYK